jgi:hypothetical protein
MRQSTPNCCLPLRIADFSYGRLAATEKIENHCQNNTNYDAGHDREIEAEVFLFHMDIAGQLAQPGIFPPK